VHPSDTEKNPAGKQSNIREPIWRAPDFPVTLTNHVDKGTGNCPLCGHIEKEGSEEEAKSDSESIVK
jgi:hypothetical protein